MKAPRIDLAIDRVVIRGLARRDGDSFVRALRAELARMLAQGGLPHAVNATRVDGWPRGELRGHGPAALGAQAARHVVNGLRR